MLADPAFTAGAVDQQAQTNKSAIMAAYRSTKLGTTSASSPATGGSTATLSNQDISSSYAQDIVYPGEDIRAISLRLLKDRNKWQTLVIINGLAAPYVTPSGGARLLKPGDSILYPATGAASSFGMISSPNKSTAETASALDVRSDASMAQQYGRDIRVDVVASSAGQEYVDIKPSQGGDVSTVIGVPNIAQAVKLKFSIKRGELPAHPLFGALFPVGTKATVANLAGFQLQARTTLLSDPRISGIKSLKLVTNGDILAVKAVVTLVNTSSSMNLAFPVRRV